MISVGRILWIASLVGLAAASGCSEPDRRVSSFTDDGAFEIRLEAERNWVFPDEELPLKVIVASVSGPVTEASSERVELIASFGSVSPSSVTATLNGPDEEGAGADSVYVEWVVFKADRTGLDSSSQGEVIALFRDAMTRLKIRIADPP